MLTLLVELPLMILEIYLLLVSILFAIYANFFLGGYQGGTLTGTGVTLAASGNMDTFLVKYSSAGTAQWVRGATNTDFDKATGVAIDSSNNIIITGYFSSTVTFSGQSLVSSGGNDIFLVEYDTSGAIVNTKRGGGVDDDEAYSIAIDSLDNIIIGGT